MVKQPSFLILSFFFKRPSFLILSFWLYPYIYSGEQKENSIWNCLTAKQKGDEILYLRFFGHHNEYLNDVEFIKIISFYSSTIFMTSDHCKDCLFYSAPLKNDQSYSNCILRLRYEG